ncbi:mtDNA inheritance, partitioning of the mitochondrial organelle [Allomyces javanicus]|nr:mtDNA inheritance, partitioning of the mitochondrial organelle [Allomyces javanicus]
MREIITLQLGNYANYVATHVWNAQCAYPADGDVIDHSILFRTGLDLNGHETVTPRTVIVDLKDNYSRLSDDTAAALEAETSSAADRLWGGAIDSYVRPAAPKSEYHTMLEEEEAAMEVEEPVVGPPPVRKRLDPQSVRTWSDYSHSYYHHKSFHGLNRPLRFEWYANGAEMYNQDDWGNELFEDHLRFFLEESDSPQGFQVFADTDDAFSGLSARALTQLLDEYPKKPVLVATFSSGMHTNLGLMTAALADAASATDTGAESCMHMMLHGAPVDATAPARYLASAPDAVALESLTLPTRIRHAPRSLGDLVQHVAGAGAGPLATCQIWDRAWSSIGWMPAHAVGDRRARPVAEWVVRRAKTTPDEEWEQQCARSDEWSTRVAYPRIMPFPDKDEEVDRASYVRVCAPDPTSVRGEVEKLARAIQRADAEAAETVRALVPEEEE